MAAGDPTSTDFKNLTNALNNLNKSLAGGKSLGSSSKSAITDINDDDSTLVKYGKKVLSSIGESFDIVIKGFGDVYQANLSQQNQLGVNDVGGADVIEALKNPSTSILFIYKQLLGQLKAESDLKVKINEQTGLTGKLSEDVRRSILNAYPGVVQLGYGIEQLGDFYTTLIEKSGRFNILNSESLIRTSEVSRAFVGDLKDMADYMNNFQKIGLGAMDAADEIEIAGVKSLSLGLRSKTTVADMNANMEKLNTYGFKNGVQGLAEMSRKATEFRMTMDGVFKVADKVFSPEGAIELSANLQVIGGILGDFNDPLKLMYMATNNVEGLQKAMIDAASSLATYNNEQGRFEITGINLRRAKAMADELGISMEELTRGAISAAERTQAATALMSTGLQMKDDDREFLTNLAQMEGGEMVIKVPDSLVERVGGKTTIALDEMTESLKAELLKNKEAFEKMDSKQIAMEQLTLTEQIDRNVLAIAAAAKVRLVQALKSEFDTMDLNTKLQYMSGVLGKSVDELKAAGGSKLNTISGAEKWIENIRGLIVGGEGVDKAKAANEEITKLLRENREKAAAERIEQRDIRHIHEYNASPSLMDDLSRFIARSPQTWENIYGAYYEQPGSFLYNGGSNFYE